MFSDDRTTLSRIDPDQNQVVAEIRLPAGCTSLVFAEAALWAACPTEDRVLRINPETNAVEKRIEVSARPHSLAASLGSIWVLCEKDGKVDRIDPKTNKVSKSIDLGVPGASGGIAAGAGSIWVTLADFPLTRIDPQTEKVVQQFWGVGGGAIQFGANAIWLSNREAGSLWRLDPKRVMATLAE
jgi:streptogramin lyase